MAESWSKKGHFEYCSQLSTCRPQHTLGSSIHWDITIVQRYRALSFRQWNRICQSEFRSRFTAV